MTEELAKLINRSILYRGEILHECIILEKDIDLSVVMHFTQSPSHFNDMHELIMDRMTFDQKIGIIQELLNRRSLDSLMVKRKEKLIKELRYVKEVRNKFAHRPMFVGYQEDEKIPKEFKMITYRDGINHIPFTKNDFELCIKRIKKCVEVLEGFFRL
ncbi:hypothetical protein [Mucilaginibacter sp.]|uniref:hypothetical protein n=1 Tax=Mucilaginibacter sp. TaxID=1882438 RepID=UPI0035BBCDB6